MVHVSILILISLNTFETDYQCVCVGSHILATLQRCLSDKALTQKIKEAGQTLDIKLLDHLIITQKDYFSFADSQIL